MIERKENKIKDFYSDYDDRIVDKRFNSPYPLRRYTTRAIFNSIFKYIGGEDKNILDAGCGDGIAAVVIVQKYPAANITGLDISKPNIKRAREYAERNNINNTQFVLGDAENLPFKDDSFDLVISSQVLEHLPSFDKGLKEIYRVTKKKAIITLPTPLNLCAISLLGGAEYWHLRKRSVIAIPLGFIRLILHIFNDGVDEHYAGKKELPHVWRYPWVIKRNLKEAGFKIIKFEACSLCFPYFNFFLPLTKFLDKFKSKPILRNFGCGTTYILEK